MLPAEKLQLVYGISSPEDILASKLLVVGAGGIGCEVMKCLALTGFKDIEIVRLSFLPYVVRLIWIP